METDKLMAELVTFLKLESSDLRYAACQQILGLLADESGIVLVKNQEDLWKQLIHLACSDKETFIKKCTLQCLINLSSKEDLVERLLKYDGFRLPKTCLNSVSKREESADESTMLLTNLTRSRHSADLVWDVIKIENNLKLSDLIHLICAERNSWEHLAQVLCNLSQLLGVRKEIIDQNQPHMKRILNSMGECKSVLKRRGVVGVVRNCCFDVEIHPWLLSEGIDIIPALVYPLAGPEELDEDENEKLPLELQYLEPDKQRECDSEIRKLLLEALLQLCATKIGRVAMKEKGIYYLMRELHKWEEVKAVLVACANLVDILIGDEPSEKMENLKLVDIPSNWQEKFKKMDEEDVT